MENPQIELTAKQQELLTVRAEALGLTLQELVRFILAAWLAEPWTPCPFRVVPVAAPQSTPWTQPQPITPLPFPQQGVVIYYGVQELPTGSLPDNFWIVDGRRKP